MGILPARGLLRAEVPQLGAGWEAAQAAAGGLAARLVLGEPLAAAIPCTAQELADALAARPPAPNAPRAKRGVPEGPTAEELLEGEGPPPSPSCVP
jgi:hypothetical protein